MPGMANRIAGRKRDKTICAEPTAQESSTSQVLRPRQLQIRRLETIRIVVDRLPVEIPSLLKIVWKSGLAPWRCEKRHAARRLGMFVVQA